MINTLIDNLWLSLVLWSGLYVSDYLLTITTARLYQGGANRHILFEKGIELTPLHRRDVGQLRWVSPRFIATLILTSILLWLLWVSTVGTGYDPGLFEFILGAWVLLEAGVHMRHFRNLFSFCYFKHSQGVEGQIRYKMWLSYRMSSVDLLSLAVLYLALYALFGRQFFMGGALACTATAAYHWILGARARKSAQVGAPNEAANPQQEAPPGED